MYIIIQAKRLFFIFLILALFPASPFAFNYNPASVKGMAQAYGFVIGQEFYLTRIAKEFPEMADRVELARAQFELTFPDIKSKLGAEIKDAIGEKPFQENDVNMHNQISETLGSSHITREIAATFLEQVKVRSTGVIESPVLEYLLAVKYMNYPAGEFADGFRQRYQTDGTGKSQGIRLNMQIPLSWTAMDGDRPHIVKKWMSKNGADFGMVALDIRDSQGYNPTKKEIEKFVQMGDVEESIPEGSTYIASGNITIEMQPGYWVQMSMLTERVEMKVYQEIFMYQFFFRGKVIGLMCSVGGGETEKSKINDAFKRIVPLCQRVMNSFVLTQNY